MKHQLLPKIILTIACLWYCFFSFAQEPIADTNYIHEFAKTNVIEIYPGIYSTRFDFTNFGQRKYDYSLVANSSAHISTNLNYKWLSLKYSWAKPGTQLDRNVKLQYTSLGLNLGIKQMRFHPFYESYNGLLIPKQKKNDALESFAAYNILMPALIIIFLLTLNYFRLVLPAVSP